ncbi:MAG: D-glycero-beta-D-manno-heptose 1-phosphate adenylyltransferase [Bacteroidetes bacterium]|nr:D-glycero-beta-D-manno-heptose 1-phosphate adenylyltransferase [Bacteroidota bacterium]
MKNVITNRNEIIEIRNNLKIQNRTVVFTNGCFDILHAGHVDYLTKAKEIGDILIVAVNSDNSVKRLKGNKRPITNEQERMYVLSQLKAVDFVTIFDEDTPAQIIDDLIPDILVKGADWSLDKIIGRETVEKHGGSVKNIKFEINQSTSKIIEKIFELYKE